MAVALIGQPMPTQIKICGLKDEASIDAAAKAGATHIGLNLYEKSPRYVPLEQAAALRMRTPESLKVVLLLVNAEPGFTAKALEIVKPDIVQFHGTETPEWLRLLKGVTAIEIWKALGVKDSDTLKKATALSMLPTFYCSMPRRKHCPAGPERGSTGRCWPTTSTSCPGALRADSTQDNVAEALHQTRAPLVDTSSGVEICSRRQGCGQDCRFLQSGPRL